MQKMILSVFFVFMTIGCDSSPNAQVSEKNSILPAKNQIDLFKTFSASEYRHDLDELADRLVNIHPQPFEFTAKADFFARLAALKARISDDTTLGEFFWMFSEVISMVGCSHTSLHYFNQEDRLLPHRLRFPVEARFIGERLFVTDPLVNTGKLSPGDEILTINGESVVGIRDAIYSHISTDGHIVGWKEGLANAYFNAYIAYHFGFPKRYEVETTDTDRPQHLAPLETYRYKPLIDPNAPCQDKLCFVVLPDEKTALITVRNSEFYNDDAYIFQAFVDESFQKIADADIEHLIVDYRSNTGGSGAVNAYLLQHFADKPFTWFAEGSDGSQALKQPLSPAPNAFTGDTYVLMDGISLSSTGHFISLVKAHSFATIIGSVSGSTYTVNANTQQFRSTNLGVAYDVAQSTFLTPVVGFPKDQGVAPDHEVIQQIDSILKNEDPVLDFTLQLIEEGK